MLDIKFVRENRDKVKKGLKRRLFENLGLVDDAIKQDEEYKKLLVEAEELRAQRNEIAKQKNIEEGKKIKDKLGQIEPRLKEAKAKLDAILLQVPNLAADDVPDGPEDNKKVIRKEGEPKKFSFTAKDHLDLGTNLGIIDVERASKVSGSRFVYLKGDAVLLEFALINYALEKLTKEGFTPILPPMLIKKEITKDLGYWHGGGNENYYNVLDYVEGMGKKELENPLYLVGTGEHSVVPYFSKETLEEKNLPKKFVAFSSCFRREAGSYGRDTREIIRVHQFDKVEMVVYCKAEEEKDMFGKMLSYSEVLMKDLGLPYQVVVLAAGDLAFPTAKTYDIETWLPGQGKYRETHSISTTGDYQARRLNIKYKTSKGSEYARILNGTAYAIGRTIIAILENYQNEDGTVTVPEVLRKWMGKDVIKSG